MIGSQDKGSPCQVKLSVPLSDLRVPFQIYLMQRTEERIFN